MSTNDARFGGPDPARRRRKPRGFDLAPDEVRAAVQRAAEAADGVMATLIVQAITEGPNQIEAARLVLAYGVGKPVAEQEQYSETVEVQRVEFRVLGAGLVPASGLAGVLPPSPSLLMEAAAAAAVVDEGASASGVSIRDETGLGSAG